MPDPRGFQRRRLKAWSGRSTVFLKTIVPRLILTRAPRLHGTIHMILEPAGSSGNRRMFERCFVNPKALMMIAWQENA
jgi:hypothetical protein